MGVDIYVLNFLAATTSIHKRSFGRTLTFGRQGYHIPAQRRTVAEDILRACDPSAVLDVIQPAGEIWADGLFRYFGASNLSAMDASTYEGAGVVHDLNLPVPFRLHGAFDTIFDGGTIEHIFDIPTVLHNVDALLSSGGLFISVNGANNFLGHGLYQFSPELMWRAFSPDRGYSVEAMYFAPHSATPTLIDAPDPRAAGKRLLVGATHEPTYLCMVARKVGAVGSLPAVYQSDYSAVWDASRNSRSD